MTLDDVIEECEFRIEEILTYLKNTDDGMFLSKNILIGRMSAFHEIKDTIIQQTKLENYMNLQEIAKIGLKQEKQQPRIIMPISKEHMLSALYGIGGTIKGRVDYKDQAYNLVQELIQLVEDNNDD